MKSRTRWSAWLLALFVSACGPSGCPSDPGGGCTPGNNDCRGDYYCSVGGVCTKPCSDDTGCLIECSEDDDCFGGGRGNWRCMEGVCGCLTDCPEPTACYDGYCQLACAETDGCGYTPYQRRSGS